MNSFRISQTLLLLTAAGWLLVTPVAAETLQLVAKHPGDWSAAPRLGAAEITFDPASGAFHLTATGLKPREHYALVQHSDQSNGRGYMITQVSASDQGTACSEGQWPLWQGKIWLVLLRDVHGRAADLILDRLSGWHPRQYLFETRILPPKPVQSHAASPSVATFASDAER